MPNVPGWTSIANVNGAFGLVNQTPGYIDQHTLTPEDTGGFLSPTDFGADPTFTFDSTQGFADAVGTADANGIAQNGKPNAVLVPPGNYSVLGGSNGIGVDLESAAGIFFGSLAPVYGNKSPVVLTFGPSVTTGIMCQNPNGNIYAGGKISGMRLLSTNELGGTYGIFSNSTQGHAIEGCDFENWEESAHWDNNTISVAGGQECSFNRMSNCKFIIPDGLANFTAHALTFGTIGSPSVMVNDVTTCTFEQLQIDFGATTGTIATGFYLGRCDTLRFRDIWCLNVSTDSRIIVSDFNQTNNGTFPLGTFPADIRFDGIDFDYTTGLHGRPTPIASIGTPNPSPGYKNYVSNVVWENSFTIGTTNVPAGWVTPWGADTGIVTPAVPATTVTITNPNFQAVNANIVATGGQATVVIGSYTAGIAGASGCSFYLPAREQITLTYAGTVAWNFSAVTPIS
jgi:hypothetical protein